MEKRNQENTRSNEERTLKELTPNVAGLLCYVAGWISGIVFLVLEQKNRFVRFHAIQSIIVFGALTVAGGILGSIPLVGIAFHWMLGVLGFVLWIILMVKAVNGEMFKMPWAGNLAEKLANDSAAPPTQQNPRNEGSTNDTRPGEPPAPPIALQAPPVPPAPPVPQVSRGDDFRARYYSLSARAGRVVASSFGIAWSVVLLIFFNFYNQYIAYYEPIQSGGFTHWQINTLITSGFNAWLPILTTTLVLAIVGYAVLIAFDKYILRQIVRIVLDVFGVATVVTLLVLFPFDFSVIPNNFAETGATVGLTIALILAAVGYGIGALVKFIQLIVNSVEGKY